jgi:hypothetical protein
LEVKRFDDKEIYQICSEIQEIGNIAIKNVIRENRAMGIPIVFSRNGKVYYELPNGEVTTKSPFITGYKF